MRASSGRCRHRVVAAYSGTPGLGLKPFLLVGDNEKTSFARVTSVRIL